MRKWTSNTSRVKLPELASNFYRTETNIENDTEFLEKLKNLKLVKSFDDSGNSSDSANEFSKYVEYKSKPALPRLNVDLCWKNSKKARHERTEQEENKDIGNICKSIIDQLENLHSESENFKNEEILINSLCQTSSTCDSLVGILPKKEHKTRNIRKSFPLLRLGPTFSHNINRTVVPEIQLYQEKEGKNQSSESKMEVKGYLSKYIDHKRKREETYSKIKTPAEVVKNEKVKIMLRSSLYDSAYMEVSVPPVLKVGKQRNSITPLKKKEMSENSSTDLTSKNMDCSSMKLVKTSQNLNIVEAWPESEQDHPFSSSANKSCQNLTENRKCSSKDKTLLTETDNYVENSKTLKSKKIQQKRIKNKSFHASYDIRSAKMCIPQNFTNLSQSLPERIHCADGAASLTSSKLPTPSDGLKLLEENTFSLHSMFSHTDLESDMKFDMKNTVTNGCSTTVTTAGNSGEIYRDFKEGLIKIKNSGEKQSFQENTITLEQDLKLTTTHKSKETHQDLCFKEQLINKFESSLTSGESGAFDESQSFGIKNYAQEHVEMVDISETKNLEIADQLKICCSDLNTKLTKTVELDSQNFKNILIHTTTTEECNKCENERTKNDEDKAGNESLFSQNHKEKIKEITKCKYKKYSEKSESEDSSAGNTGTVDCFGKQYVKDDFEVFPDGLCFQEEDNHNIQAEYKDNAYGHLCGAYDDKTEDYDANYDNSDCGSGVTESLPTKTRKLSESADRDGLEMREECGSQKPQSSTQEIQNTNLESTGEEDIQRNQFRVEDTERSRNDIENLELLCENSTKALPVLAEALRQNTEKNNKEIENCSSKSVLPSQVLETIAVCHSECDANNKVDIKHKVSDRNLKSPLREKTATLRSNKQVVCAQPMDTLHCGSVPHRVKTPKIGKFGKYTPSRESSGRVKPVLEVQATNPLHENNHLHFSFGKTYKVRILKKESNVGNKVHRERKERESKIGQPRVITLKKMDTRPPSSESGFFNFSRPRRNSIIEFLQKRLSSATLSEKKKPLPPIQTKNELMGNIDELRVTEVKSEEKLQVFPEKMKIKSRFEIENQPVSPKTKKCETVNEIPQKFEQRMNLVAHKRMSPIAKKETYNIIDKTPLKKKIEELRALRSIKRQPKSMVAILNMAGDILSQENIDESISEEKTYKKTAPGITKLRQKLTPEVKKQVAKINQAQQCSTCQRSQNDEIQPSYADKETLCNDNTTFRPPTRLQQLRSETPLYPSIMKELGSQQVIQWSDKMGNVFQVTTEGGRYGRISSTKDMKPLRCLAEHTTKRVDHITKGCDDVTNRANEVIKDRCKTNTPDRKYDHDMINDRKTLAQKAWGSLDAENTPSNTPNSRKRIKRKFKKSNAKVAHKENGYVVYSNGKHISFNC